MTAAINTASTSPVALKGRKSSKKSEAAKAAHLSVIENLKASYVAPTLIPLSEQLTPEEEDARSAPAFAAMTAPAKANGRKPSTMISDLPGMTKTTKTKATKAGKTATAASTKSPTKATKPVAEVAKTKTTKDAAPKTLKDDKPTKPAKVKTEPKLKKIPAAAKDDARIVANASDGKLNTDQVRILRVLRKAKEEISRADLKEGVGIGRDGMYSQAWLTSLKSLDEAGLIKIITREDVRGLLHKITPKGVKAVEVAEKAAAKAT